MIIPAAMNGNEIEQLLEASDEHFPLVQHLISNRNEVGHQQSILRGLKRPFYSHLPLFPDLLCSALHLLEWNWERFLLTLWLKRGEVHILQISLPPLGWRR